MGMLLQKSQFNDCFLEPAVFGIFKFKDCKQPEAVACGNAAENCF